MTSLQVQNRFCHVAIPFDFPWSGLSLMQSDSREETFLGLCGACGGLVLAANAGDKDREQYGAECTHHHLLFCKRCCEASAQPVPCRDCARGSAKGSSDPVLRSLGRYAPQTLESHIGLSISYINYDPTSEQADRRSHLIRWIDLMSPYDHVSTPL